MPEYLVRWEINMDADTEREAAELALDVQRDRTSIATCFDVFRQDGTSEMVDLDERP